MASLPEIGAEVVRVAFRLGVQVNEVSENLKIRAGPVEAGPGDSWAYVVPDVVAQEVQEELDAYHTSRVRYLDIPLEKFSHKLTDATSKRRNQTKSSLAR